MRVFKSLDESELVELIAGGAIGLIPTATIYETACSAKNQASVKRLFSLATSLNQLATVIASSIEQLVDLGLVRRYLKAVEQYWPGSVSVMIACSKDLDYLNGGSRWLPVRISAKKSVVGLLKKSGPLLTLPALTKSGDYITNLAEAKLVYKNSLDFYVDGGDYINGEASAIIKIIDDAVEVVRPGTGFAN